MRIRLDQALVARGLAPTRSKARDAILRGLITVDGTVAHRAATWVGPDAQIEAARDYVSRSAHKLIAALDAFGLSPAGRRALDAGASTGGFTEVLLERGASEVIALDVGHDQLAPSLRADARVRVLEGMNARHLTPEALPFQPDAVVIDVSFISLALVLPPVSAVAAASAWLAALIKPQFEVGRAAVGRGGLVRDPAAAHAAAERIAATLTELGWRTEAPIPCPLPGGDGNRELLIAATRP